MKNKSSFLETVDEQNGDIYWNRVEPKKLGGKKNNLNRMMMKKITLFKTFRLP